MLKKQFRLPASIKLQSSRSFNTTIFSLRTAKNNLEYSRFGFVVGKNVDKRATARNRIRRLFRSCIEELKTEIQDGYDMLFFLKTGVLEMERKELYNQIYGFLKEKNLLK